MSVNKEAQIIYRQVADLIPYVKNPRTHSDDQVAVIAGSIREFGWTNPVLIDGRNGIIAGHGRVLAARKLGLAEVPCIELSHLSEAQRRAYVIADNQTALRAGWDDELLKLELGELEALKFDLPVIGFDDVHLVSFLAKDGGTDPAEEWTGMPAFDHQDQSAFQSVVVHFKDQEAVDKFAATVGAKITEKTKFIWFPEAEIGRYFDKRYATNEP